MRNWIEIPEINLNRETKSKEAEIRDWRVDETVFKAPVWDAYFLDYVVTFKNRNRVTRAKSKSNKSINIALFHGMHHAQSALHWFEYRAGATNKIVIGLCLYKAETILCGRRKRCLTDRYSYTPESSEALAVNYLAQENNRNSRTRYPTTQSPRTYSKAIASRDLDRAPRACDKIRLMWSTACGL